MEPKKNTTATHNIASDIQQQMSGNTPNNTITINNFGGKDFLQVTISMQEGGYVGIRHHEFLRLQESYNSHTYPQQETLRNYLASMGYLTNSDKWLAFKTFGQYHAAPKDMMTTILAEIKSILLVVGKK